MGWPIFDFGSAPPYQQIFDYGGGTTGNPIYIGWAPPGVATSDAKWKIRKFTYDGNSQVTNIKFANGDVGFNAIWDNRATITFR
jgi:YD repeat-containing protein